MLDESQRPQAFVPKVPRRSGPCVAWAQHSIAVQVRDCGSSDSPFAAVFSIQRACNVPSNEPILPHKSRHDQEQRDYLACIGISDNGIGDTFHLAGGGQLAEPALNAGDREVSQRWQRSSPKIVVVGHFLTNEALEHLRRFCWGSTVWRTAYEGGYLGAFPESGFACRLLLQIADEMRRKYPTIFGSHPLTQLWAFKYDSQLPAIGLHADFAAVNVNFWITPDDANLDPNSGGLVIWDKAAPLDWDWAKYNDDATAAREFLARVGARSVTVPYRSNRAVIFDSDLFHQTDRIVFTKGYLNRRINITVCAKTAINTRNGNHFRCRLNPGWGFDWVAY